MNVRGFGLIVGYSKCHQYHCGTAGAALTRDNPDAANAAHINDASRSLRSELLEETLRGQFECFLASLIIKLGQ